MRRNAKLIFIAILALTVLAGVFIYPNSPWGKWRPWRLGLDLVGGSHLEYNVDLSKIQEADRDSVLNGLRDVIERRVNLFGVSEPQVFVAHAGEDTRLIVELAGIRDIAQAIRLIGETPFLDFREVQANGTSTVTYTSTNLDGRYVKSAQLTFDQTLGKPQVSISFNDEGAQLFEQLTERNVGKPVAIFLDNVLIEEPVVQTKISGGQAVITGRFTLDAARQLVERFNAGALPAPITLVNQQTISASLGFDSFSKTVIGGVAGTVLVMIFMIFFYGFFGIFAAVSLIIYIILTLAVFKLIPVTLTLAGLAGFVLTIGMAVDANILIFERTYEETKRGLARTSAIEEGFKRAWPSVRDSNVSTLITALILFYFTASFIRGFALTLLLGVIVSMFSAITVTRTLMRVFIRNKT